MVGQQVSILKEDGCNKNVISRDFVNKHKHILNVQRTSATIRHSSKKVVEKNEEMVIGAEVEIGTHRYSSNWVVADCRYDVMLGVPWHVACQPKVDYDSGKLSTNGIDLPTVRDPSDTVKVHNLGVKKFRSLLRKKKRNSEDFIVFQVRVINNKHCSQKNPRAKSQDEDIIKLEEEFSTVFRDDLPSGLPPKRDVDHRIEVTPDSQPPHRGIFQLSSAELLATKEYVTDLLRKKKPPANIHMGHPSFL